MHHSTCVTHVPWCSQGSLTSVFLLKSVVRKTFPAFPAHAQPTILHIRQDAHVSLRVSDANRLGFYDMSLNKYYNKMLAHKVFKLIFCLCYCPCSTHGTENTYGILVIQCEIFFPLSKNECWPTAVPAATFVNLIYRVPPEYFEPCVGMVTWWPSLGCLGVQLTISQHWFAPNRRQAIIWTNADPIHWPLYATLGVWGGGGGGGGGEMIHGLEKCPYCSRDILFGCYAYGWPLIPPGHAPGMPGTFSSPPTSKGKR